MHVVEVEIDFSSTAVTQAVLECSVVIRVILAGESRKVWLAVMKCVLNDEFPPSDP
jgi:hypothetical protein